MGTLMVVIKILLCVLAVVIIGLVLKQKPKDASAGAAFGQASSYSNRVRAKSLDEKLSLYTKIAVGIFVVLTISMMVVQAIANA